MEEHARKEAPHLPLRDERRDERTIVEHRSRLDHEGGAPGRTVLLHAQGCYARVDQHAGGDQGERYREARGVALPDQRRFISRTASPTCTLERSSSGPPNMDSRSASSPGLEVPKPPSFTSSPNIWPKI